MKWDEWKFKPDIDPFSSDFWYDLTAGGYIRPEDLLDDPEQIARLNEAITLVSEYEEALQNNGWLQ